MVAIQYASELDKFDAIQKYRPIVTDLSKSQLEILALSLLSGWDLDLAFDFAMSTPKEA